MDPNPDIQATLGQALKYAHEFSLLYQSVKKKRWELQKVNEDLEAVSRTLQTTLDELREQEKLAKRMGRILDRISQEIFVIDASGFLIQNSNNGACQGLGYSNGELNGRNFYELMNEALPPDVDQKIKALRQGKIQMAVFETLFLPKSGKPYPVEIHLHRTLIDEEPILVAIAQNITERKLALDEINRLPRNLELENSFLREEVKSNIGFGEVVGQSMALQNVLQQVNMVAKTDSSILIQGETGTGKELVTRAIHEGSSRKNLPLVRVNCCAIPNELFESEFFGHVKGAFTGAANHRIGRFELADGGTLFLDEVSEIPLNLQGKLLRVLQDGQFERIGENKTQKVDVRIIAATNRNLKLEMKSHRFREDLYYRLSVVPIEVPPLRERGKDIRLLADHFLRFQCARLGIPNLVLEEREYQMLEHYPWPGNVRELQNVMERLAILSV
ncbi:MAG: sigma-54 interaction domain-containing protein, partial [Nitrospinaceae bacterium]